MASLPPSSSNVAHVRPMMKPRLEQLTQKPMYQSIKLNVNGVIKNVLIPIEALPATTPPLPPVQTDNAHMRSLLGPQSRSRPAILQRSKTQTKKVQVQGKIVNTLQRASTTQMLDVVSHSHLSNMRSVYADAIKQSVPISPKPATPELKIDSVFSLAQPQHFEGFSNIAPIVIAPDDGAEPQVMKAVAQQGVRDLFDEVELMEKSAAEDDQKDAQVTVISSDSDNENEEQEFLSRIGMVEASTSADPVVDTVPPASVDPFSTIREALKPKEPPQLMNYCHVVLEKYNITKQCTVKTDELAALWKECDKCPLMLRRQHLLKRHLSTTSRSTEAPHDQPIEPPPPKQRLLQSSFGQKSVSVEVTARKKPPPKQLVSKPSSVQKSVSVKVTPSPIGEGLRMITLNRDSSSNTSSPPLSPVVPGNKSQSKRFLMVKTNAGAFLVPMETDGTQTVSLPMNTDGNTSVVQLSNPSAAANSHQTVVSTPQMLPPPEKINSPPPPPPPPPKPVVTVRKPLPLPPILASTKKPVKTSLVPRDVKKPISSLSISIPASTNSFCGNSTVTDLDVPTAVAPAKKDSASDRIKRLKDQLKKDQQDLAKIRKDMEQNRLDSKEADGED